MQIDRIYIDLNDIDKINARIKKLLQKYAQLEPHQRQEARSCFKVNQKNVNELTKRI